MLDGQGDQWHLWVCVSVCVCVCPYSKSKTAWAINTGTHILYGSRSACIDPEVKRSRWRLHDYKKRHGHMAASSCCGHCATAAVMGLHVVWLLRFLVVWMSAVQHVVSAMPRQHLWASLFILASAWVSSCEPASVLPWRHLWCIHSFFRCMNLLLFVLRIELRVCCAVSLYV